MDTFLLRLAEFIARSQSAPLDGLGSYRAIRPNERADFLSASTFSEALDNGLAVTILLGLLLGAYLIWEARNYRARQSRRLRRSDLAPAMAMATGAPSEAPRQQDVARSTPTISDSAEISERSDVWLRLGLKLAWALGAFLLTLILSALAVLAVLYLIYGPRFSANGGRFGSVIIAALFAGFWGWKRAPTPDQALAFFRGHAGLQSWPVRLAIAVAVPWTIFILVAVFEFGWLGSYWRGNQHLRFWLALIGPPLLAPLIVALWNWALRKP